MRIEQLEQFIVVVDEGSMSEAARKLFVSRSSLSMAMKTLEEDLGAPLFERMAKGIMLTEFGVKTYYQAKDICDRVAHLKGLSESKLGSTLTVASLYSAVANDAFAELCISREGKNANLFIEEVGVNEIIGYVSEGFADLGIVSVFPESAEIFKRMLAEKNLEYHEVATIPMHAIVGPKNPLYHSGLKSVKLADIREYPHIEQYSPHAYHTMGFDFGFENQSVKGNIKVSDIGLAKYIVANTDAILLNTTIENMYEKGYDCDAIPVEDESMLTGLGWIKHSQRKLTPLAEDFVEIFSKKATEKRD